MAAMRLQLQERALYAEKLISQLKPRIQILREAAAARRCQAELVSLKDQNERLRSQIAVMVNRLSAAEKTNGIAQIKKPEGISSRSAAGPSKPIESVAEPAAKEQDKPKTTKKEKKVKPKAEGKTGPPEAAPVDVSRLLLVVGKIIDVKKHPDADGLYVETVDLAEERGPRTIVSGLVRHVPIEQMQGRLAIFCCNLKPNKLRGIMSEGMIMCASTPEKVQIIDVPKGSTPGDRVSFEEYPGEADKQMNPKKKIWETVQPDLKVNAEGIATYKGCPFNIQSKGTCSAPGCANFPIK